MVYSSRNGGSFEFYRSKMLENVKKPHHECVVSSALFAQIDLIVRIIREKRPSDEVFFLFSLNFTSGKFIKTLIP